jgi:hypothetical protein
VEAVVVGLAMRLDQQLTLVEMLSKPAIMETMTPAEPKVARREALARWV